MIAPLSQRVEGVPALARLILNEEKLRRVLACMLDENEFLSPYGIRSLSRYHSSTRTSFHANGTRSTR
jgi:glycogen debranching enzyme